jgi:hypothetical protein
MHLDVTIQSTELASLESSSSPAESKQWAWDWPTSTCTWASRGRASAAGRARGPTVMTKEWPASGARRDGGMKTEATHLVLQLAAPTVLVAAAAAEAPWPVALQLLWTAALEVPPRGLHSASSTLLVSSWRWRQQQRSGVWTVKDR